MVLDKNLALTPPPDNIKDKEFDIYSTMNLFGKSIHFVGEVKLYNNLVENNSSYFLKIKKQMALTHETMLALGVRNYEIHLFLLNGLTLDAKINLEALNITVHGPTYLKSQQ